MRGRKALDLAWRARQGLDRRLGHRSGLAPIRWMVRALAGVGGLVALVRPTGWTGLLALAFLALAYEARSGRLLLQADAARAEASGHLARAATAESALHRSAEARRAFASELTEAEAQVWASKATVPSRFARFRRPRQLPNP